MNVGFSRRARRDLEEIFDYIASDNPEAARRVCRAILDTIKLVSTPAPYWHQECPLTRAQKQIGVPLSVSGALSPSREGNLCRPHTPYRTPGVARRTMTFALDRRAVTPEQGR